MEQIAKTKSSIYLDINLKNEAKKMFKEYGLNLSDGINLLLKQATENKKILDNLNIEPIYHNDSDLKFIEKTKNDELISLDEFLKL